ncbi:hypothetical protein N7474_006829 [Penicillium riverlandense]|uniref:uncharacterized protein n=1 Tax=Penicillium riverlandense TaxID=1903569 RepID=UPI0025483B42|nr:uncharacterized protein N7474_006829 [Penicillium riverlandense]KAJ5815052.1 hypothetical protein N7474_006829 [Penicillium riverlandense]
MDNHRRNLAIIHRGQRYFCNGTSVCLGTTETEFRSIGPYRSNAAVDRAKNIRTAVAALDSVVWTGAGEKDAPVNVTDTNDLGESQAAEEAHGQKGGVEVHFG